MNEPAEPADHCEAPHPDFLYIGLQRTGSTFLRGYFTAHPDIVWTREGYRLQVTGLLGGYLDAARQAWRERAKDRPAPPGKRAMWVDMYESLGMGYRLLGNEPWRADLMISPAELVGSGQIDLERREMLTSIRELMPTIRIVLTIRNQVDWIISNYHHFIYHMPEDKRSFVDFLGTVEGRVVAAAAHFDALVEALHSVFGRGNVLVLPLEQTEREPQQGLARLSAFLGLAAVPFAPSDGDLNRGIDYRFGRDRDAIELARAPRVQPAASPLSRARRLWRSPGEADAAPATVASARALRREFGPLLSALYAASNVRLLRLVDFDARALGYSV
jgi:hypothetical protein